MEADAIERWIWDGVEPTAARPPLPRTPEPITAPPVALAVSVDGASAFLGYSRDHFDRYVMPDLRVIRKGRRVTVPVHELHRWVHENAARALKG